ncbi:MAG: hypothetical protein K5905_12035 [Roseibium sp.]|uniref:hypothetical protein n=1 Tax=Roseibium sp. TaxID=1936156 RepID=UPI0026082D5C|nr:hypothetical protein [Roseibium sp.]MCV0426196.1 hypothetical protein [Roseibium sp.]
MSTIITSTQAKFGNFDAANGMLLTFGAYTGTLTFPARSTGNQTQAWNLTTVAASNIDTRATFAAGSAKFDANGYFTSNWFSFGGSGLPVMDLGASNGFIGLYQLYCTVADSKLTIHGRQFLSNNSTVEVGIASYRVVLLGFANTL